jgi:succinoglycan biosynthesis transport protein ExoP
MNAARASWLRAMRNVSTPASDRRWLLRGGDELFRGLYTRAGVAQPGTIAVCSALPGDGRTTLSIGLALTLAQDHPDWRVAVLETDLLHPVIADDFGVAPAPGLVDALLDQVPLRQVYRSTALDNLRLIPSAGPTDEPERLLRTHRMAAIVAELRSDFDLLIMDTPAVLSNSDAQLVTRLADSVLFVVRAGAASDEEVDTALAQIDRQKLRGVVLNAAHSSVPGWIRKVFGL